MAHELSDCHRDEQTPASTSHADPPSGTSELEPTRASGEPILSGFLVGLILLLAALAYRRLLFWDPSSPGLPSAGWFFFRISETTPQIVFLLFLPLLYFRRRRLARALRDEGSPGPALPFLVLGVALFVWAHHSNALDQTLVSLLAVCFGSALLLFGRRFAGEMALLLLFLACAIPFPGVVTNLIIFPLQLATAVHTEWLLDAVGISAIRVGDMIHLADSDFMVIETCSGLRSMVVLTMGAVAWLCLFPTRRLVAALLILSAPAISYVANTVRVFTLVLNPESQLAPVHTLQGVGVFLGGLLMLYGVDELLRHILGEGRRRPGDPRTAPARPGGAARARRRRAIALTAVLAGLLSFSLWGPQWKPGAPRPPELALPQEIDGWRMVRTLHLDRAFLGGVAFRRHWYQRYARDGETVSVFVGYDDRLERTRSLLSAKNGLPGRGWHVEERSVVELEPGGLRVAAVLARSIRGRTLSYHWYEGAGSALEEVLRAWLATDQSFLRRAGAWVVRVSTEVPQTPGGRARAEQRLRRFVEMLPPRAEAGGPGA